MRTFGHFGSTLGALGVASEPLWITFETLWGRFWDALDDFGVTLNSLCIHESHFTIILACFQKTLIFCIVFYDFMELRCQLEATLASLGCTLVSLWRTLASLWLLFGPSGC